MKAVRFITVILSTILINGCVPLPAPTITKHDTLEGYKYVFISPTSNLTSGTDGVYGPSTSKSVNPGDVISGILLKEGYTKIPELKQELLDETLIVNYGESGKRNRALGETIEVTIQFISAKTYTQIYSCTAEGQGETEADDIRQAIARCLSGLCCQP